MSRDKAFEAENGFLIENGPFLAGGAASPVGALAGQAGDFYIQNTGTGPVFWVSIGSGVNDWRLARVSDLLNVLSVDAFVTTLNGSHTLSTDDDSIHVVTGTATGYSFILPDATTLPIGRRFEFANDSSESIEIKDDGGNILVTLIAGDSAIFTLQDNATTNGDWLSIVVSSAATGITSYVLTANAPFSTTNAADTLITGFSVTPVSGRYALFYSSEITITQNNRLAQNVAYVGGTAEENTRRLVQGLSANYQAAQQTIGEVIVNGAQTVDMRVNISAGSLSVNQRSLVLIRLGA